MATRARTAKDEVIALAIDRPELGSVRAARELQARSVRLSPSGVRAIWQRHGIATTYQRLMLRKRKAGHGGDLSDSQRALLQRIRVSRRLTNGPSNDAAVRREHLIAAAARVIGRKGYDRASLQEICAAAGILPGSLYYHFKSKEELFITVHAESFRQLNEAVDAAIAGHQDPWMRLEAACTAHLVLLVGGEEESLVAATSLFHPADPQLQRRLNRDRAAYEERFRKMIAALQLPPGVNQALLRLALLGMLNWTRVWYQPGKQTPQQIAHHLVNQILRRPLAVHS